jgi:hypothetical protein
MHRWKSGNLHSGENGPVVKSRKQALAIAINECKHSERLQSLGFSEEVAERVADMLDFADLDWKGQFETGKGPGKNNHPVVGPSDRKHPKGLVPKIARNNSPKQEEPEILSPVAYPKGPGNPQGGSSKDVKGLRMLG